MSDRNHLEIPRQDTRGSGVRIFILAGVAALIAGVIYVITGGSGKESGKESSQNIACAASIDTAKRIGPLAKGQIAALNVHKTPKVATEITFDGPDGKKLHLSDFRGKTVLLNLWATWCVPCRVEMPALDRLQAEKGSAAFEVVAINIDTARLDRRQAFLDSVNVNKLAFYADPKADVFQTLKQAGKVVGLPATILIDEKGCELGIMAGPAEWDGPEALALIDASLRPADDPSAPQKK